MKIVFDCRRHKKSGIGTFADNVLARMLESDNEFLLLGFESLPQEFSSFAANEKIKCLPCSVKAFSIKELFFFPKETAKIINRCDVYFSPYCNVPWGIKIPVFTTIHDILFLDMPEIAGKAGTFVRKLFYKYAILRSKALFTVSEFSKKRIIEKLGCKKPLYVTYNGVPEYFLKSKSQPAEKTDTIIFIGNIKKHKGLQVLIPAFLDFCKKLSESDPAAKSPRLVIVGSRENFRTNDTEISSLIENSSSQNIDFTGFISDSELKSRLSQARILVQPSFYEGFGLPPLQALNCGTNVIASDIEVFKEVYQDYPVTFFKCGDKADLCENLLKVWKEKLPLPDFEEKYSFEKTARTILSLLREKSL